MVRTFNSVGSPTASPSSLQNFAPSLIPENRQRLAGKADNPGEAEVPPLTAPRHALEFKRDNVFYQA
jgi:hypothetical protein